MCISNVLVCISGVNDKRTFLYNAVSSLLARSKHFTLHSLAELFILTSTQLLWEEFSHTAITVRRLFTQIFPLLSITP